MYRQITALRPLRKKLFFPQRLNPLSRCFTVIEPNGQNPERQNSKGKQIDAESDTSQQIENIVVSLVSAKSLLKRVLKIFGKRPPANFIDKLDQSHIRKLFEAIRKQKPIYWANRTTKNFVKSMILKADQPNLDYLSSFFAEKFDRILLLKNPHIIKSFCLKIII